MPPPGERRLRVAASDALHKRVQRLARELVPSSVARRKGYGVATAPAAVLELALEVARYQARFRGSGSARLPALSDLGDVAALPVDALRFGRVACHPPAEDAARFFTSGTTTAGRGMHAMRRLDTYACVAEVWGRAALRVSERAVRVVALAPPYEPDSGSSLCCMMHQFMKSWSTTGVRFLWDSRPTPGPESIDVDGLREVAREARRTGEPVVLLATSFALAFLLERDGERALALPDGSVVMPTGGFKGYRVRYDAETLDRAVCRKFALPRSGLVYEYGMTELSSQLYALGGDPSGSSEFSRRRYCPPPWLLVDAVDSESWRPLRPGQQGLARFIDVANIDSNLAFVTQDLIVVTPEGVELLGRAPSAPLRGCSLALEPPQRPGRGPGSTGEAAPASPRAARIETDAELEGAVRRVSRFVDQVQALRQGPVSRELCSSLARSTGLSEAGVQLALATCLESPCEPVALRRWVSRYRAEVPPVGSDRVVVLLSSNVFTAAFRAIACALALGPNVWVKPSRRELVFPRALESCAPGAVRWLNRFEPVRGDQVWVYGQDATVQTLQATLPPGVRLYGYGAGFGVALLEEESGGGGTGEVPPLGALARDVALFDQAGCLSPRVVLVRGSAAFAAAVRKGLLAALAGWAHRVPLGPRITRSQGQARWYEGCAAAHGVVERAEGGSVSSALLRTGEAIELPPPVRHLAVVHAADFEPWLAQFAPRITAVGCADSLKESVQRILPSARVSGLGDMQCPPLDGPADRRPPLCVVRRPGR